mgnify:CR=1 FL=1
MATIKTELIRFVRNSSNLSSYRSTSRQFFQRLRTWGYPISFLKQSFSQVSYSQRKRLLYGSSARFINKTQLPRLMLHMTRHPVLDCIRWYPICNTRMSSERLHQLLSSATLTWSLPNSISKLLVRAKLSPPQWRSTALLEILIFYLKFFSILLQTPDEGPIWGPKVCVSNICFLMYLPPLFIYIVCLSHFHFTSTSPCPPS